MPRSIDRRERREDMMVKKLQAIAISVVGTALPCLLAGAIVGMYFRSSFWYWALGIAVLAFIYACLDRIPVRFFAGTMRRLPLGELLKYGYASTDKRPVLTDDEIEDRRHFNIYSYDHFYGDRDK
jgi:hypothetical protein